MAEKASPRLYTLLCCAASSQLSSYRQCSHCYWTIAHLLRILLIILATTFRRVILRLLICQLGQFPRKLFNLRLQLFVFLIQDAAELGRLSKLLLRLFELPAELLSFFFRPIAVSFLSF